MLSLVVVILRLVEASQSRWDSYPAVAPIPDLKVSMCVRRSLPFQRKMATDLTQRNICTSLNSTRLGTPQFPFFSISTVSHRTNRSSMNATAPSEMRFVYLDCYIIPSYQTSEKLSILDCAPAHTYLVALVRRRSFETSRSNGKRCADRTASRVILLNWLVDWLGKIIFWCSSWKYRSA